jgi:Transcriptional regulators
MKMSPNIKDVANMAGVSATTVSAYLNKSAPVNGETGKKIKNAITKLGYRPNLIARSLKIKNTKVIGIIFPDIENAFFTHLILKAEEIAYKNGYSVILCNTDQSISKEKEYVELLKGKQVDGYLIITTFQDNHYLKDILEDEKVVYIDRNVKDDNGICVQVDNLRGIRLGMEYLLSLGHKRIGFINIPLNISPGMERFEAYRQVLAQNKINYDENIVRYAGFSVKSAYEQSLDLLSSEYKPTAIISAGILTSIGTLHAIKELNLKIPKDISFISFDEIDPYNLIDPQITVIEQPDYKIGELATNILIEKINGKEFGEKIFLLEPKLIIRKSCKKIL